MKNTLEQALDSLSNEELKRIRRYFEDAEYYVRRQKEVLGTDETNLGYEGILRCLRDPLWLIHQIELERRR